MIAAIGAAIGLGRGAFIGRAVSRDLDLPTNLPADHLALRSACGREPPRRAQALVGLVQDADRI